MNLGRASLRHVLFVAAVVVLVWLGFASRTADTPVPDTVAPPRPSLPDGDRSRRPPSRREVASVPPDAAAPAVEAERPPAPQPAPQAAAGLAVDARGSFYPDASTIALFESQLSRSQPVERSAGALRAEIQSKLEPPAETEALEFLDRYLRYRERGIELGLNQDVVIDFRPRFAQLRSLRREFFGIEVGQRLFGDEEREANIALREHEILSDPDLSDEERTVLLEELYNPPPEQRE